MNPTSLVALAGNPNAGKSALFNALTGARQKVGNYPGVTVERKSGRMSLADGRPVELLDLPGTYSLQPSSPDEAVTHDVLLGKQEGERLPSALLVVIDATNLDNHLRFALQLIALGLPTVVALNMIDMAERDGLRIDAAKLSAELGVPVIPTVAVRRKGVEELKAAIGMLSTGGAAIRIGADHPSLHEDIVELQRRARAIAVAATTEENFKRRWTHRADAVALHPVIGPILLATILFLMFQAVFSWATPLMDGLDSAVKAGGDLLGAYLPDGLLKSLLVDGLIAGLGSVVVFLPQILILFLFILTLEESGYLPRAAFLLDRLMMGAGLSGRSFIPLLSSFACAIPGIMATRTIQDPRDRLATILVAPLMTCSARLPVYALLIGAFIPARTVGGVFNLQGLVLFALYVAGIISALVVAYALKFFRRGHTEHPLLMELPSYRVPNPRDIAIGLWERARIFLSRVGKVILTLTVLLWFLASFPGAPAGATAPAIDYSFAGMIGHALEKVFAPVGFNWQICIALVPGLAAREVAVGALGTVYALSGGDDAVATQLAPMIASQWSLPTALAFLAWFVYAPQCVSTIAVMRRETNGWKWTGFMLAYLFILAYAAAGITYWTAVALGL
jgi:ferrous iron transport protein B